MQQMWQKYLEIILSGTLPDNEQTLSFLYLLILIGVGGCTSPSGHVRVGRNSLIN